MSKSVMPDLKSQIYCGKVHHQRFSPVKHKFDYSVFSMCIDLDELNALDNLKGFSVNRFNLFSFHEKDHGLGYGCLKTHALRLLEKSGVTEVASVRLLCYPRIFGYTFNPLSVFFAYDRDEQLTAILYEVTNTFKQRHTYLLPVKESVRQQADKLMYVSPFMPMATNYEFDIKSPDTSVKVAIKQTQNQQSVFFAAFSGRARAFTSASLATVFLRYPLMTFKVVAAIHWQAFKLWRKGLALQNRPEKLHPTLSWQDQEGVVHCENL